MNISTILQISAALFVDLISARRISPTGGVWSATQRLVFCDSFQIGFGIAVQYQLGVCHRVIVDQIVQL